MLLHEDLSSYRAIIDIHLKRLGWDMNHPRIQRWMDEVKRRRGNFRSDRISTLPDDVLKALSSVVAKISDIDETIEYQIAIANAIPAFIKGDGDLDDCLKPDDLDAIAQVYSQSTVDEAIAGLIPIIREMLSHVSVETKKRSLQKLCPEIRENLSCA